MSILSNNANTEISAWTEASVSSLNYQDHGLYGWSYNDLFPLLREARFEWYEPEYEEGQMILGIVAV